MKLKLYKVHQGNHPDEYGYAAIAKQYDRCDVFMSNECIKILKNGKTIFESMITLYEDGSLTVTHKGSWPDGKPFRIVRPGPGIINVVRLTGQETLTFGSMYTDGYAVSFLVN